MTVKTVGLDGPIHKRARIISNAPTDMKPSVSIKAKIRPVISVKPRSARLRGLKGDEILDELTVRAYEDRPLILEPAQFSISDRVDYKIETLEEGKAFRLIFRNKLNHKGKYRGMLQVKTNYPEKPLLKIRIYGEITGSLQVTPERVHFGRLNLTRLKASNTKVLVRSLNIRPLMQDEMKIEKIDYNRDLFEVNIREVEPGRTYAIELKLPVKKIRPGRLREKLTIHTNLNVDPVNTVEVSGYVKE